MSNQPYPPDPRYQQSPNEAPTEEQTYVRTNDGETYARREHYTTPAAASDQVETRSQIVEDENQRRVNTLYWATRVINFVFGVLEVILLLRFIFRLLAANQASPFVALLYNLSYVFAAPFQGIFTDPHMLNGSVLEVSTLVAMIVYGLIAWGLVALLRVLFIPDYASRRSMTTTTRRRHYP